MVHGDPDQPTEVEEQRALKNLFPSSRAVGRNMHKKHFLLVVAADDILVSGSASVGTSLSVLVNRCPRNCAAPWRLLLALLLVPFQAGHGTLGNNCTDSNDDSGRRLGTALVGDLGHRHYTFFRMQWFKTSSYAPITTRLLYEALRVAG